MSQRAYKSPGSIRNVEDFKKHLQCQHLAIPCDIGMELGERSPLAQPIQLRQKTIGNRFCIHPMEGWDGTRDGRPSEHTFRRWRHFGRSGAKLIWGGEAVAVRHEGRANPNQLLINDKTKADLARLRESLVEAHREATGNADDLLVGLQLTHSGRYSCPSETNKHEPRILYHHPMLDRRLKLNECYPVLTDGEIRGIIEDFQRASRVAYDLGFDFVDIKHCHGYLGHEFLSAHTRTGPYGGCFRNRTRFLREVVEGVRTLAPGLEIGVRFSAFDTVPFEPGSSNSSGKIGVGVPVDTRALLPYHWGFGVNVDEPEKYDLSEAAELLTLFRELDIKLVNVSAGSPYYNPHIQRPALYPPSDGYQPPEDPLIGVARQLNATRVLKQSFPDLIFVGSAYSYLQDFVPFVAQAAVREGWVDSVGLGRMVLSYPDMPLDIISGKALRHKLVCRTFSDCTTAPRNGLPSGCYPLDHHYRQSPLGAELKQIKSRNRGTD